MTIFLPKYPLKEVLTSKVGLNYLIFVRKSSIKKIGQIGALGKMNSEGLEIPNIRKYWSLQFGEMGVSPIFGLTSSWLIYHFYSELKAMESPQLAFS